MSQPANTIATMAEFLRGAVELHILHHAAEHDVHGAWMSAELAEHGYRISPGTLYPTLHRLERRGLLGMKPYPAKKVLAQARRLGHDGVVRAVKLVAEADVDLRGRSGQDPRAVIETLVARLAALSSRSGASRSGGRRAVRPGRPR